MSETVDARSRYQAGDVVGERCGREIDEIGALRKTDWPPGPPMHRDGMFRLDVMDRMCGLLGVEMAIAVARDNARSPASDWHEGYVDVRRLLQLNLRTCVPRVPPPARTHDEKAERGSAMRASKVSPTIVVSGQDTYLQVAMLYQVPRRDLPKHHPAGGDLLQQAA